MATASKTDLSPESLAAASVYIDGEWHAGEAAGFVVDDPTTGAAVVEVPSASAAQVEAALDAARAAQRAWARTGPTARASALHAIADLLRENMEPLLALTRLESGKANTLSAGDVGAAALFIDVNAEWATRIEGEILPSDSENETINLARVPYGVVAAICAWNYGLATFGRKLGPALVTGNTLVAKPSEVTPLATIAAVRLIDDAGILPTGVLNLVTGATDAGRALTTNPKTDLITFTGHRDTGKAIMADAAPNLTRVALELGGKAAAIVAADADLDVAVPALVTARFVSSGQQCGCAERILVDRTIHDEFVARYTEAVAALTVGDPSEDPDVGPMACGPQVEKVAAAVERAKQEGATVATGGGRPEGEAFATGHWYRPTVLTGVTPEMAVAREETFGPVIPVLPFDSLEEAFRIANDTRYGLAGYFYSTSYRSVMEAQREMRVGELFINRTVGEALHAHHAGQGESGYGGEDGKHGMLKYTQLRVAYHNW